MKFEKDRRSTGWLSGLTAAVLVVAGVQADAVGADGPGASDSPAAAASQPVGSPAPARVSGDGEREVVARPVVVRARLGAGAGADEHGPAGDAAEAEAGRRALDEPAFVTSVAVEGRRGETVAVAEALTKSVGVSVRSYGGLGAFASLSVRGAPAAQTEILVNGVPLSRLGFATLDLGTLDVSTFERVNVYRGGVPVELGGAALGGAVNLVTPVGPGADGRRSFVTLGAGSFGARQARLVRRDQAWGGRLRSTVGVGYAGARGDYAYFDDGGTPLNLADDGTATRTNNGYNQLEGLGRVRLGTAGRHVELGERLSWKAQGVPGPAGTQAQHASLDTLRNLLDVRARRVGALGLPRLDLGLRGHALVERQRWKDLDGEIGIGREDRTYLTLAGGATLRAGYAVSRQLVAAALEARVERFGEDNRLTGTEIGGTRAGAAFALSDEIVLGVDEQLVLQPSVRLDVLVTRGDAAYDSVIGLLSPGDRTDAELSPRAGARWRLASALALKANVGRYFRAPTLIEIFGDRGFVVGNPELAPETGVAGDLGLVLAPDGRHGALDRVYLEAAGFASRARDLIALQASAGRARAANLADAWIAGAEISAAARVLRTVTLAANYTFLHSEQRSELVSYDGKRLPGRPRHELYARLDLARRLGSGRRVELGCFGDVTLVSGNFLDAANLSEVPARRFVGAGLRVSPWSGLAVTVEGKNLLDETVETVPLGRAAGPGLDEIPRPVADVLGYPLPGRAFYASIDWSF